MGKKYQKFIDDILAVFKSKIFARGDLSKTSNRHVIEVRIMRLNGRFNKQMGVDKLKTKNK